MLTLDECSLKQSLDLDRKLRLNWRMDGHYALQDCSIIIFTEHDFLWYLKQRCTSQRTCMYSVHVICEVCVDSDNDRQEQIKANRGELPVLQVTLSC